MQLRLTLILMACTISFATIAQCPLNIQLSSLNSNCAGNSTLKLSGASNVQKITWYRYGDSVGVSLREQYVFFNSVAGGNGAGSALNQLRTPFGICLDRLGRLYVADMGNHRILRVEAGNTTGVVVAGGNGVGAAANQLSYPTGVWVDSLMNIYIADQGNNRIQKWAAGATIGTTIAGGNGVGTGSNQFNGPISLCFDKQNNLYVADSYNNRIQRFAPGSNTGTTVAGGNGPGGAANQLNYPEGIVVSSTGALYIADQFNNRIQKWLPGATSGITVAGAGVNSPGSTTGGSYPFQLSTPEGVYIDPDGYLLVSDASNHRVMRWPEGYFSGYGYAGSGQGSGPSQFNMPTATIMDQNGFTYVADYLNHRIQKWRVGISTTFSPTQPGVYKAVVEGIDGCAATSNTVRIFPSQISVSAKYDSYKTNCLGLPPFYQISLDTTGIEPAYQWYRNSQAISGAADNFYSGTQLTEGDSIKCRVILNAGGCVRPDTIISNGLYFKREPVYTFIGNGSWETASNWQGGQAPPAIPDCCSKIVINPAAGGECVLNAAYRVPSCVELVVADGKKLRVQRNLQVAYDSSLLLNKNVRLGEQDSLVLISTAAELSAGIYKYRFNRTAPVFNVGDVLVGPSNGGYIRKITSITSSANVITLQTTTGSMENAFKQGKISMNITTDSTQQGVATGNYNYSFNDVTLVSAGPNAIKLNNGTVDLNPNWEFDFDFKSSKLNRLNAGFRQGTLNSKFDVQVIASQSLPSVSGEKVLKSFTKYIKRFVPVYGIPVPVVIEMKLEFIVRYSASLTAPMNKTFNFQTNNTLDLYLNYDNGNWTPTYARQSTGAVQAAGLEGNVNANVKVAIVPKFSFKIYGLAGPYAELGLNSEADLNIASPSLNWDFTAGAWLSTTLGASAEAFGQSVFDYNKTWTSDTVMYKTPSSLTKVSGDNQTGAPNFFLRDSIRVTVKDIKGISQANVPVQFVVRPGNGIISDSIVLTSGNGTAAIAWKLGTSIQTQHLTAIIKNAAGVRIGDSVYFSATTTTKPKLSTLPPGQVGINNICSGGNLEDSSGSGIIKQGICYSTGNNPNLNDRVLLAGVGNTFFSVTISNCSIDSTYYVRAFAINRTDTGWGNVLQMKPKSPEGTVTDIENNIYRTKQIGNQIWMIDNLRTKKFRTGQSIQMEPDWYYWSARGDSSKPLCCYWGNNPQFGNNFGLLYNYWAVSNPAGICPLGWRVPSMADFDSLKSYIRRNISTNWMRAAIDSAYWNPPVTGEVANASGFSVLPAGERGGEWLGYLGYKEWEYPGIVGILAAIDVRALDNQWYYYAFVNLQPPFAGPGNKKSGLSCRCIKE